LKSRLLFSIEIVSAVNLLMTGPQARLVIVSAPSGAGKTSLARALAESTTNVGVSVSHTTRPARDGERDEKDYFFVSRAVFERMIRAGEFLEHAHVFDYLYGTARTPVEAALAAGQSIVLDIDWQGARKVRAVMPEALSIFILPPSLDDLEQRLVDRGQDTSEVIRRRMQDAASEIIHYPEFDYVLVNRDFQTALEELRGILHEGRAPRSAEGFDPSAFLRPEKNGTLKR
jgi:guanylate kinase